MGGGNLGNPHYLLGGGAENLGTPLHFNWGVNLGTPPFIYGGGKWGPPPLFTGGGQKIWGPPLHFNGGVNLGTPPL